MKKVFLILTILIISNIIKAQTYYAFIYNNNNTTIESNIIVDIDETMNLASVYTKDFHFTDEIGRTVYAYDKKNKTTVYTYHLTGGGMIIVKTKGKLIKVIYIDAVNNPVWFIDGMKPN